MYVFVILAWILPFCSGIPNRMVSVRVDEMEHGVYGTLYVGNRQIPVSCLFRFGCDEPISAVFPAWVLDTSTSWTAVNQTLVSEIGRAHV